MSDDLVEFNQLNDDAKQKAVKEFAKFYVKLVQNDDMELITSYDVDGVVQDINRDIFANEYNSEITVIDDTISDRFGKYEKLLNNIDQKYFANGNPESTWPDWYQEKYKDIPKGL